MPELALPEVTSQALLGTRAGLVWRVILQAAREDRWTDWEHLIAEVLEKSGDHRPDSNIQCGHKTISLAQLLEGISVDPDAVQIASRELCQGLRLYLEKLATAKRVRWAGRLAKVLNQVHGQTSLRPFSFLTEVQTEDQASIWDAVLSALVTRDRAGVGLAPWSNYLLTLPEHLHQRWREQLADIELSGEAQGSIFAALTSTKPVEVSAARAHADTAVGDDLSAPEEESDAQVDSKEAVEDSADHGVTEKRQEAPVHSVPISDVRETTGSQASALALELIEGSDEGRSAEIAEPAADESGPAADESEPAADESGPAADESEPAADESEPVAAVEEPAAEIDAQRTDVAIGSASSEKPPPLRRKSERVVHSLERTEQVTFPPSGDSSESLDAEGDGTSVTVFSERVVAHTQDRSASRSVPVGWELKGGYAGRPLPGAVRVLLTVTGLIFLATCVRLVLRFLFGLRRRGRMWLDQDTVVVEASTFFLGREMRQVRRSFGPEGLMSVVREVRYPYIYLFIGLFALCFGALTGTIAYLDGRLAGFEDWIRTGLILIIGGLVVDFVFTVLQATRPGKTSLSVTFKPGTTLRILGVDESAADAFLSELVRKAHAKKV